MFTSLNYSDVWEPELVKKFLPEGQIIHILSMREQQPNIYFVKNIMVAEAEDVFMPIGKNIIFT